MVGEKFRQVVVSIGSYPAMDVVCGELWESTARRFLASVIDQVFTYCYLSHVDIGRSRGNDTLRSRRWNPANKHLTAKKNR